MILDEIVAKKKVRVIKRKNEIPIEEIRKQYLKIAQSHLHIYLVDLLTYMNIALLNLWKYNRFARLNNTPLKRREEQ